MVTVRFSREECVTYFDYNLERRKNSLTRRQYDLVRATGRTWFSEFDSIDLGPGEFYRVLICGSRFWLAPRHRLYMKRSLLWLPPWVHVAHGDAPGADTMAADLVADYVNSPKEQITAYPAPWPKWRELGLPNRLAAGPYRNRVMYDTHKPHLVLAFHDDWRSSKGTKDMVNYARDQGAEIWILNEKEREILE